MQHQLAGRKTVGKRRSLAVSGTNISREGEGMRSERVGLMQLGRFHLRADEFLRELQHRVLLAMDQEGDPRQRFSSAIREVQTGRRGRKTR